jgi:TolB-like protein
LTALALLASALVYVAFDQTGIDTPQDEAPTGTQSIAVLPFVNLSDDPDNEYFSDGLSEELLNRLARVPGLKVIGRTSSFSFKGKNEDLRTIGRALGVRTVLEGSVLESGDQVRISTRLVDTSDGTMIWSDKYDRTMTDIFAVQDQIAAAILDEMKIRVGTAPARRRPTGDVEAHVLYLKAREAMSLQDSGAEEARSGLLRATELDPEFAEAYELLAHLYWTQYIPGIPLADTKQLMRDQAAAAIEYVERYLRRKGYTDTAWLGDLITRGRDPVSGQAYLDEHIPVIVRSAPPELRDDLHESLDRFYLFLGHLDRYFEIIFERLPDSPAWTGVSMYVWYGTVCRDEGFTAHPRYLELASRMGMLDVWERRGPPDFCSKTGGRWVCE